MGRPYEVKATQAWPAIVEDLIWLYQVCGKQISPTNSLSDGGGGGGYSAGEPARFVAIAEQIHSDRPRATRIGRVLSQLDGHANWVLWTVFGVTDGMVPRNEPSRSTGRSSWTVFGGVEGRAHGTRVSFDTTNCMWTVFGGGDKRVTGAEIVAYFCELTPLAMASIGSLPETAELGTVETLEWTVKQIKAKSSAMNRIRAEADKDLGDALEAYDRVIHPYARREAKRASRIETVRAMAQAILGGGHAKP